MLRLVGAGGFPDRRMPIWASNPWASRATRQEPAADALGRRVGTGRYAAELEQRSERFCRSHGCARAQRLEIEEMVHEDMHCAYQWYRIFPAAPERPYMRALKKEPKYAQLFTPLDHMLLAWLKAGWAPRHAVDANGTVRIASDGRGAAAARAEGRTGSKGR